MRSDELISPRARRGATSARAGRRSARRARGQGTRGGFTLIELIVAIVILVVGILGLAGTAGMVSRMVGGAGQQTVAATLASSRFERFRAIPCDQVKSGSETTRHVTERWGAAPDPNSAQLLVVTDTITYNAAGGRTPQLVFQSYIRCD